MRALPLRKAKRSRLSGDCSNRENGRERLRHGFAVLDQVRYHAERQSLRLVDRLSFGSAVGHDTRKADNLGKPAAVILTLDFDSDRHAPDTSTNSRRPGSAALELEGTTGRCLGHRLQRCVVDVIDRNTLAVRVEPMELDLVYTRQRHSVSGHSQASP
jgi:hypothetical protein